MQRREFITLLGGAAAAWPLAARAQQPDRMRRIGVLMAYAESDREGQAWSRRSGRGSRSSGGRRAATSGSTLAGRRRRRGVRGNDSRRNSSRCSPTSFFRHDTPPLRRLLQQTRTIPIVFATVADPVGSGFVASFARPGGNVTGFINSEPTMAGKWLELLKEIAPRVNRVAFLFNPATAPYAEYFLNPFKAAAASFGCGGDRRTCSRHVRARIRRCRTGTRAEWRPDRDAGCLH